MTHQHFIGYVSFGYDDNYVPCATGHTRNECLDKTIQRALMIGALRGTIDVQYRPEISIQDFAKLTYVVDKYFDEHFGEIAPRDSAKSASMPVAAYKDA